MGGEPREAGVLFADISDSSYLIKTYGNEGARDILNTCLDVMRGVVEAGPGRVVEKIGDELLLELPTPDSTLHTAVELQTAVAEARTRALPGFISIRIGFHFGEVLDQEDGLFGETVYVANRVTSLAKGNQILTTGSTVERVSPELRQGVLFAGKAVLKGTNQIHEIYRVSWNDPERTAGADERDVATEEVLAEGPAHAAVELSFQDRQLTLSTSSPVCTIGRSRHCDIQVESPDVSRVHTRVEYRRGHFVVVDVSSNGTTVRMNEGKPMLLVKAERRLDGSGVIQLSESEGAEIRYTCILAGAEEPAPEP